MYKLTGYKVCPAAAMKCQCSSVEPFCKHGTAAHVFVLVLCPAAHRFSYFFLFFNSLSYYTVGHKSHDPCLHVFLLEAGFMTIVAHCTVQSRASMAGKGPFFFLLHSSWPQHGNRLTVSCGSTSSSKYISSTNQIGEKIIGHLSPLLQSESQKSKPDSLKQGSWLSYCVSFASLSFFFNLSSKSCSPNINRIMAQWIIIRTEGTGSGSAREPNRSGQTYWKPNPSALLAARRRLMSWTGCHHWPGSVLYFSFAWLVFTLFECLFLRGLTPIECFLLPRKCLLDINWQNIFFLQQEVFFFPLEKNLVPRKNCGSK